MTTEDEIDASKAPLLDHLLELRNRLMRSGIAFIVLFILAFAVSKIIYNFLLWPYEWAASTYPAGQVKLIYTEPLGFLFTQIRVAFFTDLERRSRAHCDDPHLAAVSRLESGQQVVKQSRVLGAGSGREPDVLRRQRSPSHQQRQQATG